MKNQKTETKKGKTMKNNKTESSAAIDELLEQLRGDIKTQNPWDLYDGITDLGFELRVWADNSIENMLNVARDLVAMPMGEFLKRRQKFAEIENQMVANG
jgi:hypothetical protein